MCELVQACISALGLRLNNHSSKNVAAALCLQVLLLGSFALQR
jgi:hypothetical protein